MNQLLTEGREWIMEIERINENTIKFYISYLDIEDRGFEREEIWYNRERSEQLFWQMMEEVNNKEEFVVEGPLWIQVQALEKGLEIIVTKSQAIKNGDNFKLPLENDNPIDIEMDEKIETILESKFGKDKESEDEIDDGDLSIIISFNDFEDVIQLSHSFSTEQTGIEDTLYHYKDKYYMYIEFSQDVYTDQEQENMISHLLEFGKDSNMSIHILEEYGKLIFENNVLTQVKNHFSII